MLLSINIKNVPRVWNNFWRPVCSKNKKEWSLQYCSSFPCYNRFGWIDFLERQNLINFFIQVERAFHISCDEKRLSKLSFLFKNFFELRGEPERAAKCGELKILVVGPKQSMKESGPPFVTDWSTSPYRFIHVRNHSVFQHSSRSQQWDHQPNEAHA